MKWRNLLNFKCPQDKCNTLLKRTQRSGTNPGNDYYECEKCLYYITNKRFEEIVFNIKNPKRFKLEPPEFIKQMRANSESK